MCKRIDKDSCGSDRLHIVPATASRLAALLSSRKALALVIVAVTLITFSPALWGGFVWDDEQNLRDNPHYRGLGWQQLRWMVTAIHTGHWLPLTWVTLGLDYLLWGLKPAGYHFTNILLHAANAGVFSFVARRLLAKAMPALGGLPLQVGTGVAALFFALHPLRAESVAWVTERRDVLSGLFSLLAVLAYLRASETKGSGRRPWLAASIGSYACAVGSKSIVVTLPLVLVLLDVYPLRRLGARWRDWTAPEARRVWVEKVPFLLLAVAGGVMALYAARAYSFLTPTSRYSLPARAAMALYSAAFYVWKTFWPVKLSPLYEAPAEINPLDPRFLLSALAVGGITVGLVLLRARWPAGLAVWIAYVVMVAPVSGLAHFGPQIVADRYSYLSCLGWALLIGAAVGWVLVASTRRVIAPGFAQLALGAAAVWVAGFGLLTWNRVQIWESTETLWGYALEMDPTCVLCHNNFGVYLGDRGRLAQAVGHFERALALNPNHLLARQNLGLFLLKAGQPEKASVHLQQSLRENPANVEVRSLLGRALVQQGRAAEALPHLELVLRQNRADVGSLTLLGMALVELGRPAEAVPHFQRAIALVDDAPLPRFGLARAYLALGEAALAQKQSEILRRLDPRLARELPLPASPGVPGGRE